MLEKLDSRFRGNDKACPRPDRGRVEIRLFTKPSTLDFVICHFLFPLEASNGVSNPEEWQVVMHFSYRV